ncbi:hypothetical protein [Yoonia sp.]|uniref:hypothetical protein n=1 Tax=Yoonia sp. TaxID=2212373 RepID=UPI0025EF0426|nr:hypothetical protein [Yoonia sp.]
MTALDRYVRLESDGLWRADPDAQRRDVTVSFGDATLVIADRAGRPLAHWSLPAVQRRNPGENPAIYTPDADAAETLEIADDLMIDAIEEVRGALDRARPKPGILRHLITTSLTVTILALTVFWLPGALTRQTLAVVPLSKRTEIGAAILGHLQRETGPACREPSGIAAATQLVRRLIGPDTRTRLVVLPKLAQGAVALPGEIIALDRALLEQTDDPAVAAGYIILAQTARAQMDPLEQVLHQAGLGVTFRLLTTGNIPPEILQANAQGIIAGATTLPNASALRAAFIQAALPSAPYDAMSAARGDGATLVANTAEQAPQTPLILSDDDWVSLQNICNS